MKRKVRYAVVGLGDIAQGAVLPSFVHARKNSELAALISDDSTKLKRLCRKYHVPQFCHYEDYEAFLSGGNVDAVYITLPNSMHCDFTVRAARHRVHVLCEKPLALTEDECQEMVRVCAEHQVQLMTAYRLHFEKANLEAIRIVNSGKIGEPRIFQSLFTQQTKPGNVRLNKSLSGGALYDTGIYCINAARYLFRDEPTEVFAFSAKNADPRFSEVDEMTSAVLRFPKDRLASFTTSFGAANTSVFTVTGTNGTLKMNRGYDYSEASEMEVTVNGKTTTRSFPVTDQFGPEILYFSDCILDNSEPEPSGIEGLLDVHIIRSLYESADMGRPVRLKELKRRRRPDLSQELTQPESKHPEKIHAESPSH